MKIIKKHFILTTLIIIYLITRLYNILLLPIFTDESIYIYWAKVISETYSQWGLSLTDGKPPLLVWTIAIFLKALPSHLYLLAGRFPSVIAGAITLFGIYKISQLLFKSQKIAIIASLLYIFNPFSLFYDRMALFDSLLTSMLIWSVYFAVKTAQTQKLKDAILWGLFLGLAFLSKPTAVIFLLLTPPIYLILVGRKSLHNWRKTLIMVIVPVLISEFINNLQRLSKVYYLFEAKNQQFQQPIEKLLKEPFSLTLGNLQGFFSWIIPYYTWPIYIAGLIAFIILILKKPKIGSTLLILWFTPIFILATAGREIFPRYILFTTPYFLIAVAFLINLITNSPVRGLTPTLRRGLIPLIPTLLLLLPSLKFDYLLFTNPPKAPLPDIDYNQYISEHPSGYGLDKVFAFLDKETPKGTVNLIIQGTFGLYPYAFILEYWDDPNLKINPRWPLSTIDPDVFQMAKNTPTYVLLKEHDQIPAQLPLILVLKSEKPGGKYPLLLTKLK